MNKFTKLLSIFVLAGAIGAGVAGAATFSACSSDSDTVKTMTIEDGVTGLVAEGLTQSYDLSATQTSVKIDLTGLKVYLQNSDGSKGSEISSDYYTITLYDTDGTTVLDIDTALNKDGTYLLQVGITNAVVTDGTAASESLTECFIDIVVNNPITSIALKDSTKATQVQSYTDTMTSAWTYVATKANGDTEDIAASKVTLGHIDTVTAGTRSVYVSYGDYTGTISYTITADSTKVEQSYLLQFNNWTDTQKTDVKTSTDEKPVVIDSVYSVVAGGGSIDSSDTKGDGLYFNTRLKFSGKSDKQSTDAKQHYIKVTAPSAGKLTIYAYTNSTQSGGTEGGTNTERKVGVYKTRTDNVQEVKEVKDGDGNVTTEAVTAVSATYSDPVSDDQSTLNKKVSVHEFTLDAAGTYYITAMGGDICFCLVRLDTLATAGEGVTEKKAAAGEEVVAKLSVSTKTTDYKQVITSGNAFTVNADEYKIKGLKANNVTGATTGATETIATTDSKIKYYIGSTELIPGTTILGEDYLGDQTVTVEYDGKISDTYTITVETVVSGVTGVTASLSSSVSTTIASTSTDTSINVKKANIIGGVNGSDGNATIEVTSVKYNDTEITDAGFDLVKGKKHTLKVTVKVTAKDDTTKTYENTVDLVIRVSKEGELPTNIEHAVSSDDLTKIGTDKLKATVDLGDGVVCGKNNKSKSGTTTLDDITAAGYIQLGGSFKTSDLSNNSIQVEAEAKGKIIVIAKTGSSSGDTRTLSLYDSNGDKVAAFGETNGTVTKYEVTITAAGIYYIGSENSSINVYYIGTEYSD